jgi:ABC-type transport system involved in multi-copper enzyme maturation permease subunit
MTNLWPIARITFLEGLRSRLFFGLFIIAILLFSSTYIISYLFPFDVIKVATDLSLWTVSFVGLILTLFLGTQLIAKDLEKRTIQMVLARAVSRSEYVVGKFMGISLIIASSMFVLGAFASLAVWSVDLLTLNRYGTVYWPVFLFSLFMIALMLVLVASVIFLFSSFASSSFLALGLTLIVYLIGQSIEELKQFLETGAEGITISPIFLKVVKVAYYIFPNLAAFDFKTQAAHGLAIPPSAMTWSLLYGIFYIGVMITAAAWIFRRREFP